VILVIGGAASGKRDYVRGLGYEESQFATGAIDNRPVVDRLQEIVAADKDAAEGLLEVLCAKEVVICDEVGSGVIPAERHEREVREATGRLCNQLAGHAEKVVRLVAGIPVVIKGGA
jgi:adenosyl cobinamide kinase/adenosyl cobinamide phosphate guanylyltransferase